MTDSIKKWKRKYKQAVKNVWNEYDKKMIKIIIFAQQLKK